MLEFENLVPRQITINGSANKGFIVQCGCCTCVFTDKKEMVNAILDYINDPEKIEKEYNNSQKSPRGTGLAIAEDQCGETVCAPAGAGLSRNRVRISDLNPCSEQEMTERRR